MERASDTTVLGNWPTLLYADWLPQVNGPPRVLQSASVNQSILVQCQHRKDTDNSNRDVYQKPFSYALRMKILFLEILFLRHKQGNAGVRPDACRGLYGKAVNILCSPFSNYRLAIKRINSFLQILSNIVRHQAPHKACQFSCNCRRRDVSVYAVL